MFFCEDFQGNGKHGVELRSFLELIFVYFVIPELEYE